MYGGYINQKNLKIQTGHAKGINPIATINGIHTDIKQSLDIRELAQFLRRYKWNNLPKGLDANIMERILYYRGRLMVFKLDDTYYSLPFALSSSIDVYGRYKEVVPLTFNGSVQEDNDGNKSMGDGVLFEGTTFEVVYPDNHVDGDGITEMNKAVLLNDYSNGISEFIVPRYIVNDVHRNELSNIVVLIKHNLISSARIYTVRVMDEGQKDSVFQEFNDLENSIIHEGRRIFPVTAQTKLEEILKDKSLETQNYWEAYVSWDNLRENLMGIENNGIFKKKERQLKGEMELEASSADLVYADGLHNRQLFAETFNRLFGENIEVTESAVISGIYEEEEGDKDDITDESLE